MAAASFMLSKIQHGLEGTPGTLVPATFKHFGNGTLKFDEALNPAGFEYAGGFAGGVVEPDFIADAGSTLTLTDAPFSAEAMAFLGQAAIKTVAVTSTTDFTFAFAFPTTAANTISAYTWELSTAAQEYEFGYGTVTDFSVHGDVGANNGKILYNAKISGRAAAASTVTGSLGLIPNLHPLNINYATIHFDAAGTAAGTASATAAFLRAFNVDVKTGWELRRYADGRAAKDGSVAVYTNYELTGSIKADLDAALVTRIANARAATPEMMAIKCNGASSRLVKFAIPLSWTEISDLNEDDGGVITVSLNFRGGYSTTTTAQGPSISSTVTTELVIS